MATDLLDQELQTYEKEKDRLLAQAKGKFVLIKGDQVVDFFDTETDAIRHGYEHLGNTPFLVKQVLEIEVPIHFSSQLLGV